MNKNKNNIYNIFLYFIILNYYNIYYNEKNIIKKEKKLIY